MGRATRWLKSLITGKKDSKTTTKEHDHQKDHKEKKRWSFTKSNDALPHRRASVEAAWLRSLYEDNERERSKHAIAVAAATAAATDAAVAAAHVAVAVVRLTNQSRGAAPPPRGSDRWAAVRIQTAFRRYLARKALRALKALVKLQALVRGYLVRKQTAATLHSMQAIIRAQASMRLQRLRPRRSLERNEETRSERSGPFHRRRLSGTTDADESPKIVEVDTGRPRSRGGEMCQHSLPLPRLSVHEREWWVEEYRISTTAHNTPRALSGAPTTPAAKSACGERHHSYMANTESSKAKDRSQSAPKQRPEPVAGKRRVPLAEIVEARASLSGFNMQRSCSRAQEALNFKNVIVGRFDRSSDVCSRGEVYNLPSDKGLYLHRKW